MKTRSQTRKEQEQAQATPIPDPIVYMRQSEITAYKTALAAHLEQEKQNKESCDKEIELLHGLVHYLADVVIRMDGKIKELEEQQRG